MPNTRPKMTVAEAGRLGGKYKGRKGLAAINPERRAEIIAMGHKARALKRKKKEVEDGRVS